MNTRFTVFICAVCMAFAGFALAGCAAAGDADRAGADADLTGENALPEKPEELDSSAAMVTVTDSVGRTVTTDAAPTRVVALTSSIADLWVSAGGALVASGSDTFRERPELAEAFPALENTGGLMEPNMELIFSLDPQLVFLSPDLAAHKKLAPLFDEAGIPYFFAKLDAFEEYLGALRACTTLTDRADLYESLGTKQREEIDALLARVPKEEHPRILFLRVSATNAEAIAQGHIVCDIVDKTGGENIALSDGAAFEGVGVEAVVAADPDFIFVVPQGADREGMESLLESQFTGSPLWGGLKAVREGRFVVLPKELFHLKPNSRWSEAYETLFRVLYPDVFES